MRFQKVLTYQDQKICLLTLFDISNCLYFSDVTLDVQDFPNFIISEMVQSTDFVGLFTKMLKANIPEDVVEYKLYMCGNKVKLDDVLAEACLLSGDYIWHCDSFNLVERGKGKGRIHLIVK